MNEFVSITPQGLIKFTIYDELLTRKIIDELSKYMKEKNVSIIEQDGKLKFVSRIIKEVQN